jgi:glycosyltransferase involved in cell wall biosynthesis
MSALAADRLAPVQASGEADCELTILMPCLNEAETVGACIDKARAYLRERGIRGEVVVADNGSTDGSQATAAARGARVVRVTRRGYGSALLGGLDAARGRYVIMGDADDSYDFASLDPFVDKLREGYDLVMGNRFRGGIRPGAMPVLNRYLGNPVLSALGRLFFQSPIGDFHCGLRGFRADAIRDLGLTAPGMEFASEMVVKATLRRLLVTEVPTTLSPDGRTRRPHLRPWRDGWRHLRFLLLFSPRWLFLYPGCLLMVLGVGTMLWLLPGPRRIGSVEFDLNTLVYAGAFVVCGFQVVMFSVFATVFAVGAGLLPESPWLGKLVRRWSLEIGLVLGAVLVMAGLVGSGLAVGMWGRASFGPLDPVQSIRLVVPAATALILGLQLAFSSFFLGVLQLRRQ